MHVFWSKAAVILSAIFGAIIQIANLFLGNIIIFETTENVRFDWNKLFHSKLFWGVVIVLFAYYVICYLLSKAAKENDSKAERAIEDNVVKLYNTAGKLGRKKDFENAEKVLNIIDKFEERRKK